MLNKLGFDQLQLVLCGGAPLPVETARFWQMFGVNVCEIYGQTETAGAIISGQRSPFPRPGDVGTLAAGIELRFAVGPGARAGNDIARAGNDAEILLRTDHRFDGY